MQGIRWDTMVYINGIHSLSQFHELAFIDCVQYQTLICQHKHHKFQLTYVHEISFLLVGGG